VEQDEQQQEETREPTGVTRSLGVVLTLPHDWRGIAHFLAPALERVDPAAEGTQLLVLTADGETAVAVSQAAARIDDENVRRVVPATSARRAERMLRARPAPVVVGTPAEIAALIKSAALKLDALRSLVIAWADEVLEAAGTEELETVMAEVPKEAARTVVVARESEAVTAFVERYVRRARRAGGGVADAGAPLALQYVSVAPLARPTALRRLLDELDPPSAVIVVGTPESADEARAVLRALGYGDDADVRVATVDDAAEQTAHLVVLYDLPATRAELERALHGGPVQVVALAQPRQLGHLRAIAGGRATAFTLPEPAARARRQEEKLRGDLRALLASGVPSRELIALEPLLDEYDGIEIAAAALRLAERERERARTAQAGTHTGFTPKGNTAAAAAASGEWKRIFMTVGERDGAARGDIVGAITGEGGVTSDRVGRVELRDSHALVEIAAADAERVAEKMNGVTIRGRSIVARLDQERAAREAGGGAPPRKFDRGDRPDRGERPPRHFDREPRGGGSDREGRPPRSGAGARSRADDRAPRGGGFDRGPRGAGGGFERGPRSGGEDRGPRGAGGGGGGRFQRDDRGPRTGGGAGFDRGARGGGFDRGARPERDDRPGRRPGPSERAEWSERADRLRNARRPRPDAE